MFSNTTVFARPTSSAWTGKQTATIKTMVTDEVAEDFARFTRERGYPSQSDCLRELLLTALYGPDFAGMPPGMDPSTGREWGR